MGCGKTVFRISTFLEFSLESSSKNKLLTFLTLFCFFMLNGQDFKEKAYERIGHQVVELANGFLKQSPVTVTSFVSSRSSGTKNDFYSEGDYWWPDIENPEGPYIRKDGFTNPENFTAHREVLMKMGEMVGTLTSAYLITKDRTYSDAALEHCKAWFLNESTRMNPNFLYAQAIKGRHTGRGIGIIDGIHFMDAVQSLRVLENEGLISENLMIGFRSWFSELLEWLMTHEYSKDEMVHPNNHGTCWNMQVATYAKFCNNSRVLKFCKANFKNTILPGQMAKDGSFPLELERTKPYGYSLFNLDAMTMNGWILSDSKQCLWSYDRNGLSLLTAVEFMAPFVAEKEEWPLEPDVMYWEEWPVAHPSFLLAAIIYNRLDFYKLWSENQHFPKTFEVKRNMAIKSPLIWLYDANRCVSPE